jgi:hypothetical protein
MRRPNPSLLTLMAVTAISTTSLLTTKSLAQTPNKETYQEESLTSSPQNSSGAVLSTLEKKLGWPLTLSQRQSILKEYNDYLSSRNTTSFLENISQITELSPKDVQKALQKYL